MPRYTTCGKCEHYSRTMGRCVFGKCCPRTLKGTKEAMRFFGPSYVCGWNKWKRQAIDELIIDLEQEKKGGQE